MRTWVDIPDRQIEQLTQICETKKISRAELIRQAITSCIEKNKPAADEAFGIWKDEQIDGLDYQKKRRSEW
jgi:metal-responsive CopG/Arc/MetJ family transcriptional regulator